MHHGLRMYQLSSHWGLPPDWDSSIVQLADVNGYELRVFRPKQPSSLHRLAIRHDHAMARGVLQEAVRTLVRAAMHWAHDVEPLEPMDA